MEFMQSGAVERTVSLDPRTKLMLLFCVSTVLITGGNGSLMFAVRTAMLVFPFGLLAVSGRVRAAFALFAAYIGAYALAVLVAPLTSGLLNSLFVATSTVVCRFVPTMALAYFVFATTTVSEFMAAMERMHAPAWLTIPLSVLFRFFPTLGEEARAIRRAMRMRGITPLGNGVAWVEYCLVPLMSCAVGIGEDLSAAALTRGLGAPVKRTNACRIGFHVQDVVAISLAGGATLLLAASLVFPGVMV